MAYVRCAVCKRDAELGVEIHCPLCHVNYKKGEQHTCSVLDEAVAREKRERQTFSQVCDDFEEALRSDPHYPLGIAHYEKHVRGGEKCDCAKHLFTSSAFQLGSIEAEVARILEFDGSKPSVIVTSSCKRYPHAVSIASDPDQNKQDAAPSRSLWPAMDYHETLVPSGE